MGRREAFDPAYAGAPAGLLQFPNTDPVWNIGQPGDTMAEVRARVTCAVDGCSSIEPSMNVIYRDVWSADPLIAIQNVDIDYLYTDLTTLSPTTLACQADWQAPCRSIINYQTIIHPLWSEPRLAFLSPGEPEIDPLTGQQVDNNCVGCHTFPRIDPADGVTVLPPAGQLELTDQLSLDEPDHLHAYRELLVADNLQTVVNGAIVEQPTIINSPASISGARASGNFFDRFEDPINSHYNMLSSAERRLIAEWLDVGAQYYNNPFDVPQ